VLLVSALSYFVTLRVAGFHLRTLWRH